MAEKQPTAQVPAVKDKAKKVMSSVKFDASFFVGCIVGAALMHFGPSLISKVKPGAASAQPKA